MKGLGLKSCSESRQHFESQHSCSGTDTSQHARPLASGYTQSVRSHDLPSVTNFCGVVLVSHPPIQDQHSHTGTEMHEMADELADMCTQIVLSRFWRSLGIHPVAAVTDRGMNIYSALNVAGVLSDADTIYLAGASIQLGLLQHTDKRRPGLIDDWYSTATANFQRLDSLTTYHLAHIPVLRLMESRGSDGRSRQETWSSNARLYVSSRVSEDNRMLLSRHLIPSIQPKHLGSKPVSVFTEADGFGHTVF